MPSVTTRCVSRSSHGSDGSRPASKVAWPSSCSIVSIHYCVGTTFASTRMSPGAVDVDAERVLALAVAREQVAAVEHGARLEPDAVVRARG